MGMRATITAVKVAIDATACQFIVGSCDVGNIGG
jgi:hypothetical protein